MKSLRITLVAALLAAGLSTLGAADRVDAQSPIASCHSFAIANGHDDVVGGYKMWASGVRRSPHVRCSFARQLLRGAYKTGPLEVVKTVYYPPSGRPTYWLRGGWRCGNGAGGAACWNARHGGLNAIPIEGLSHGMAVMADVSIIRR
jgi:hypothetical protein